MKVLLPTSSVTKIANQAGTIGLREVYFLISQPGKAISINDENLNIF